MSNRILMTATAALLAAGPALAGGFAPVAVTPVPAAPVVIAPPAPSADWSGPYVGGQLGYGSLSLDDGAAGDLLGIEEDDESGALYGLHAGYMFDFGRLVAGAEVDFDGTNMDIVSTEAVTGTEIEVADIGSVRRAKLRLGYDAGQFLPYVTAGLAQVALNSDTEALDDTFNGNFFGLGVSYALSDRFMVGVEGLRHSFDDFDDAGAAFEGLEADVNTVTLRGSFRF
jgi:opacity protein-like surface antigen